MRLVALLLVCAGVLLAAAGCDSLMANKFFYEGAGKTLYSADGANQTALLNEYIKYVCDQGDVPGGACGPAMLVQAGMNDIDRRCDAYLSWLDAQRRNKEPVLAEISAIGTAAHAIMTVTGATPEALDIASAAFGLATASYNQWNSRLLLAINQSTVQTVVYSRQQQFRAAINGYSIPDRPYAIYLLRNYLRICMPITIETDINTSTTLVQRGAPTMAEMRPPVRVVRPMVIRNANVPLRRYPARPRVTAPTRLGRYEESGMSGKDFKTVLGILGCSGSDLGPVGSPARRTLAKFLRENGKAPSDRVTDGVFFTLRELKAQGKKASCDG